VCVCVRVCVCVCACVGNKRDHVGEESVHFFLCFQRAKIGADKQFACMCAAVCVRVCVCVCACVVYVNLCQCVQRVRDSVLFSAPLFHSSKLKTWSFGISSTLIKGRAIGESISCAKK